MEGTGSWYKNYNIVTVAPPYQVARIIGNAPSSQSNDLYYSFLAVLKATQTCMVNSDKENTTPHPFGNLPNKNKDTGMINRKK